MTDGDSKTFIGRWFQRIGNAISRTPPDDRLMSTPTGEDWAETSLSREQLDDELDRGDVHPDR